MKRNGLFKATAQLVCHTGDPTLIAEVDHCSWPTTSAGSNTRDQWAYRVSASGCTHSPSLAKLSSEASSFANPGSIAATWTLSATNFNPEYNQPSHTISPLLNAYYGGWTGRFVIADTMKNSVVKDTENATVAINAGAYTHITWMFPTQCPNVSENLSGGGCGPIPTQDKGGDTTWQKYVNGSWKYMNLTEYYWDTDEPGVYRRILSTSTNGATSAQLVEVIDYNVSYDEATHILDVEIKEPSAHPDVRVTIKTEVVGSTEGLANSVDVYVDGTHKGGTTTEFKEVTSGSQSKLLLAGNTYVVKEETAPAGYELLSGSAVLCVKYDGTYEILSADEGWSLSEDATTVIATDVPLSVGTPTDDVSLRSSEPSSQSGNDNASALKTVGMSTRIKIANTGEALGVTGDTDLVMSCAVIAFVCLCVLVTVRRRMCEVSADIPDARLA